MTNVVRLADPAAASVRKRPPSMRGIRVFCVAARHQSFRLAAEELFISASAVSHQIRKLEDEFQIELFNRTGRAIELTIAGEALFNEIDRPVQDIDTAIGRLCNEFRTEHLRVSVQPFFASELVVPRLSEFTAAHPNIDINIETSNEASERHPASADLSIRLFRVPPAGLTAERLFPLRLVPACSPAFRNELNVVGWRLAKAVPMVVHSSRPNAWMAWSQHSGIQVPQTSNYIRLDSMTAVVRAAAQGLGAALVPVPLAQAWFDTGRLVRLFDYELVTADAYYMVYEPDQIERPEIRALRDWVLQSFAINR